MCRGDAVSMDDVRLLGDRKFTAPAGDGTSLAAHPRRAAGAAGGRRPQIVKLQRDSNTFFLAPVDTLTDGERVMSLRIEQVTVVAKVRSVPERNGSVKLDFIVSASQRAVGPQPQRGGDPRYCISPTGGWHSKTS